MRPATAASPAELAVFLAARPEVQFIEAYFTNLAGVPRGKRLRAREFAALYEAGQHMPGSLLALDITGMDVGELGAVWEDGDADRLAWPVAGTLARALWIGGDSAEVMLTMHELDGQPCALDPRAVLQRVLDRFAADGLTPVIACELEFYLVDARRTRDGGIRSALGPDGRMPEHRQVFGLDDNDFDDAFIRDLWAACDALGLPTGAAIGEYAPGQYEVTLAHRPDALAACDDAVRFKRAAKGVARHHGRTATFMAKAFAALSGSGLHLHVSVNDASGRNIFADDRPEGTPALGQALAGCMATMADAVAVFAPNANSYRRLRPPSDPQRAGWAVNDRTVPLRIPPGAAVTRHFEHRVAGADANPYLAAAVILAGVHHGLTQRLDAGPPVGTDGYSTGERLPTDWGYATERFARSDVLTTYLGQRAVETFATIKRVEQERYSAVVTPLDYDWVLRSA